MVTDIASVGEIVIPLDRYPHLYEDEPVGEGVAQLLRHISADGIHLHYDELLIINKSMQLVGHLTVQNILSSFFPSLLPTKPVSAYAGKKEQYTDLSILFEKSFRQECRRQAEKVVRDYMTKPRRTIAPSWHPLHALEVMIKENLGSLPVVEDAILIGAVRITDIFRILGTYCTL